MLKLTYHQFVDLCFMHVIILAHLKYYNVAALVVDKIRDDKHIRSTENKWRKEYGIV